MSRPLRIDYPNAWHHVMNRARGGKTFLWIKRIISNLSICFKKWNWLYNDFVLRIENLKTALKATSLKVKRRTPIFAKCLGSGAQVTASSEPGCSAGILILVSTVHHLDALHEVCQQLRLFPVLRNEHLLEVGE